MQNILKKILHGIKNIILFIFKLLISIFPDKNSAVKEQIKSEKNIQKDDLKNPIKKDLEDDSGDTPRELFKEYLNHEKFKITEEKFQEEINDVIEKIFKLKIKDLAKEEKENLKKYIKKIFPKINEDIKNEKIKNKEELEKILITKIKKDSQEKGIKVPQDSVKEKMIEQGPFSQEIIYTPKENQSTNEQIRLNESDENNKIENNSTLDFSSKNDQKIISSPSIQPKYKPIKPTMELNIPQKKDLSKKIEEEQIEDSSKTVVESLSEVVVPTVVQEEININEDDSLKKEMQEIQEETKNQTIENKLNTEKINDRKQPINNSEKIQNETKKQEVPTIIIPFEKIENQNNQVMEQAETEIKKEEFIEKDYEAIEKLLNDQINDLEILLNKPLKEEQKEKINKEIKRLKNTKEKVSLHKEKDLEEIRVALESSILLEEIEKVKENLKELYESEEIKMHQDLINNITYKSVEEMKKIEKALIKESLRKTLRKLEIPLFISFPFIKNKFFRRFVSGLFIFRSLGFVKNMLFGIPSNYEPIDLSYLQKGHDALQESIGITIKNLSTLEEIKRTTLIKYPELVEDEEFLSYINKIEEKLEKNYQKLLKQDKVVNKYFNKSKVLVRKRKKSFFE